MRESDDDAEADGPSSSARAAIIAPPPLRVSSRLASASPFSPRARPPPPHRTGFAYAAPLVGD